MHTSFEQLSPTSKIWIYQSEREFTPSETILINNILQKFSSEWDSHGAGLKNSFKIEHNQFIIIAVDENINHASGCSIDKSVNIIKSISEQTGLNLLDKTNIAYVNENGGIEIFDFKNTKSLIETGTLNENSRIFNNLISQKQELENHWKVSLKDTWLKRYLK